MARTDHTGGHTVERTSPAAPAPTSPGADPVTTPYGECFIIMPITTPSDLAESRYRGDIEHFAHVLELLFEPAVARAGYRARRPHMSTGVILAEVIEHLRSAAMVLVDISSGNQNVLLEAGIRVALDLPMLVVHDNDTAIPYDLQGVACMEYETALEAWDIARDIDLLAKHLTATAAKSAGHNDLWQRYGATDDQPIMADPRLRQRDGGSLFPVNSRHV